MLAFFAENPWLVRRRVGKEKKKKRQSKNEIRRWGDYTECRTCNAAGNDNWGIYAKFTNIFHKYHNIGQVFEEWSDIWGEISRFRMLISLFLLLLFVFQHDIYKKPIHILSPAISRLHAACCSLFGKWLSSSNTQAIRGAEKRSQID